MREKFPETTIRFIPLCVCNGQSETKRFWLIRPVTQQHEAASALTLGHFAHDVSGTPSHAKPTMKIQRTPEIGPSGDIYERQADRSAERVMSTPEMRAQPACACGGQRPTCRVEQLSMGHESPQTSRVQGRIDGETSVPPIVDEVVRAPGHPLEASAGAFFERRFGYNLSRVRTYTDAKAAESVAATNALDYTVGEHIAFAPNSYAPGTSTGRKLLAHESAHVLQQRLGSLARQPSPPAPAPSPQSVIADANTRRIGTLLFVLSELSDVINTVQSGLDPNPYTFTAAAIQHWLFVAPGDPAFLVTVQAAQQLFLNNLGLTPRLLYQSNGVQVDPFGNACPPNFAYSRGGVDPIFICDNFLASGPGCQRDVMIHEHFHLLGLIDLPAVTTTAQAMGNPDSLAQLAAEIADGPHSPCCLGTC